MMNRLRSLLPAGIAVSLGSWMTAAMSTEVGVEVSCNEAIGAVGYEKHEPI